MMDLKYIILLNVISFYLSHAILNKEIILEFSKAKSLSMGTMFLCSSAREKMDLAAATRLNGLRYLIVNVNHLSQVVLNDVLYKDHNHFGVILDADCNNLTYLINKSGENKYFFETYHWLVLSKSKETAEKLFRNAGLNINSDAHLVVPHDTNFNNWTIFDMYNPASSHGGSLLTQPLGFYNNLSGYKALMTDNKYWIRKNMTGVHFKSAIVIPHLNTTLDKYLNNNNKKEINSLNRFQSVTIDHCREMYNFSLHVQRTNSWGYIQKSTGRFDGLVGLLENRVVDFGSSPLVYKMDRMPVVDYSFGNWILRSVFIYRRPKIEAKSYEIFLRPLATNVWITICVLLVLITVALKTVFGMEERLLNKYKNGVDSSWSFLLLFTLGAFCQQGATCYPRLFCSRILSVFVFLFCILVYQFYSASIVSYLLMDQPRTIFTLKDLLDSNLRAGIEDILIDRDYFVQTTDPNAIELFDKKIKGISNDSGFYAPIDGLKLVQDGGFALHVQTSTAYHIIEETFTNREICELEEVQMYRTQPMYTNLQKHSPFREMINYCMLKMVEDGKMDRLRKFWDARKPTCIESAKKIEFHVGIGEFSCGLIVLSYGILFSLTFILIEFIIYHKNSIINRMKYPIVPIIN